MGRPRGPPFRSPIKCGNPLAPCMLTPFSSIDLVVMHYNYNMHAIVTCDPLMLTHNTGLHTKCITMHAP